MPENENKPDPNSKAFYDNYYWGVDVYIAKRWRRETFWVVGALAMIVNVCLWFGADDGTVPVWVCVVVGLGTVALMTWFWRFSLREWRRAEQIEADHGVQK